MTKVLFEYIKLNIY